VANTVRVGTGNEKAGNTAPEHFFEDLETEGGLALFDQTYNARYDYPSAYIRTIDESSCGERALGSVGWTSPRKVGVRRPHTRARILEAMAMVTRPGGRCLAESGTDVVPLRGEQPSSCTKGPLACS